MNRDISILLSVALLATMFLPRPAVGQRPSPGSAPGRQTFPALLRDRDAAGLPRDGHSARTITRRQHSSATSAGRSGRKTKPTTTFWKTVGALALIVVLILTAGRFLKRRNGGIGNTLPAEAVELLGRRSLDGRQAVHLVRLGSRILVLGSSPEGLRPLAEITDPVEIDYLAGLCQSVNASHGITGTFRSLFAVRRKSDPDGTPSDFDGRMSASEPSREERFSAGSSSQSNAEFHQVPG